VTRREWNRTRLTWWLNSDHPDRWPGSSDPGQVIEARKLEGRVILRAASLDTVDAHYQAKRMREEGRAVEEDYARSHKVLLYLTDVYMRYAHPHLDRTFKEFFLTEHNAGAVLEIERFERLAKEGAPLTGPLAEEGRMWMERVLDELERWNYRLWVRKDQRAANRLEAHHQDRTNERVVRDDWIRLKFDRYKEETKWTDAEIRRRLCEDFAPRGKDALDKEVINRALRRTAGKERQ
jgi:hypothetical protein